MSTIKQIKAPISDEIAQFNKEFISNIKTEKGLLDKILRYIIKRKGKNKILARVVEDFFLPLEPGGQGEQGGACRGYISTEISGRGWIYIEF